MVSDKPFFVDTGSSTYHIGVTLLKPQEDEHPTHCTTMWYWSCSLTDVKRWYLNFKHECTTVIWYNVTICPYIEGTLVTIKWDHKPLCWLIAWIKKPTDLCVGSLGCPHSIPRSFNHPEAYIKLLTDCPDFRTSYVRIPTFEYSLVLPLQTKRATKNQKATENETNIPPDLNTTKYFDDSAKEDNQELEAIDLYQATDFKAYIDSDHWNALEDADRDSLHDYAGPSYNPWPVCICRLPSQR